MDSSVKHGRGRAFRVALIVAGLAGVSAGVSGCQSDPDIDITNYAQSVEPADVLYNQGLANLQAGQLTEAGRKFDAVDKQHPYSEFARKSMVMSAFTNYRQGQYTEAINTASRYLSLYPNDEDAAYAQYIVGLS